MKQQCYMVMIYLNWAVLVGGLGLLIFERRYGLALVCLLLAPFAMWAYIRAFPSISERMGYGRLDDRPAQSMERVRARVRLYTAVGCPFCPVVKRRLMALRQMMDFSLEEIDVTLKPGILLAKGIRAVPVIEAGDRRVAGNLTSEQLAELIREVDSGKSRVESSSLEPRPAVSS
jgi:glutaredoxin